MHMPENGVQDSTAVFSDATRAGEILLSSEAAPCPVSLFVFVNRHVQRAKKKLRAIAERSTRGNRRRDLAVAVDTQHVRGRIRAVGNVDVPTGAVSLS